MFNTKTCKKPVFTIFLPIIFIFSFLFLDYSDNSKIFDWFGDGGIIPGAFFIFGLFVFFSLLNINGLGKVIQKYTKNKTFPKSDYFII